MADQWIQDLSDADLFKEIDEHEQDCNHIESSMLSSMMSQVAGGRELSRVSRSGKTPQRPWAEKMLQTFEDRS